MCEEGCDLEPRQFKIKMIEKVVKQGFSILESIRWESESEHTCNESVEESQCEQVVIQESDPSGANHETIIDHVRTSKKTKLPKNKKGKDSNKSILFCERRYGKRN